MSAMDALARLLGGTVPEQVWNADEQAWETVDLTEADVTPAGGLRDWLERRAEIVDAEEAQARRDRSVTYGGGPADRTLHASLDERHVWGALSRLGVPPAGLRRLVLERDEVTVTQIIDGAERVTAIPVVWP